MRPLRDLLGEAVEGVFSWDSRLWTSLRLLMLRPGWLSLEYSAGRRARYTDPLRLFLFASLVSFLLLSVLTRLFGVPGEELVQRAAERQAADAGEANGGGASEVAGSPASLDGSAGVAREAESWRVRVGAFFDDFGERMTEMATEPAQLQLFINEQMPRVFFFMVPVLAALAVVFFWRRRLFVEHLVFSLHLHAAGFVLMLFERPVALVIGLDIGLAELALMVYSCFAFRRFYGVRWGGLLARLVPLGMVYATVLSAVLVGVLWVSLSMNLG